MFTTLLDAWQTCRVWALPHVTRNALCYSLRRRTQVPSGGNTHSSTLQRGRSSKRSWTKSLRSKFIPPSASPALATVRASSSSARRYRECTFGHQVVTGMRKGGSSARLPDFDCSAMTRKASPFAKSRQRCEHQVDSSLGQQEGGVDQVSRPEITHQQEPEEESDRKRPPQPDHRERVTAPACPYKCHPMARACRERRRY